MKKIDEKIKAWIDARKRFHLSHAHVQLARELGMNPHKLGKLANHDQEPWKAPLPDFIEHLYFKRLGRDRPAVVMPLEQLARAHKKKQAARKAKKAARRQEASGRAAAQSEPSETAERVAP